jgi:hypothetical protein
MSRVEGALTGPIDALLNGIKAGAVRRSRLDDGELVEFTLTWEEGGVSHMCHQAHILRLHDGRVASDTAFCGGRWPAPLIAEMAASKH